MSHDWAVLGNAKIPGLVKGIFEWTTARVSLAWGHIEPGKERGVGGLGR